MKSRLWTVVLATALSVPLTMFFAVPTRARAVDQSIDKFSGVTHYFTRTREADLEGGSFFSMRYVKINLSAFSITPDRNRPYILTINTFTPEWVFIRSGQSLDLKLDGSEMMYLSGGGSSYSSREVLSADSVLEAASYRLTLDELARIGRAKTIEFRVYGDKQTITGSLPAEFMADAAAFALSGPSLLGIAPAATQTISPNAAANSLTPLPPQPGGAPLKPKSWLVSRSVDEFTDAKTCKVELAETFSPQGAASPYLSLSYSFFIEKKGDKLILGILESSKTIPYFIGEVELRADQNPMVSMTANDTPIDLASPTSVAAQSHAATETAGQGASMERALALWSSRYRAISGERAEAALSQILAAKRVIWRVVGTTPELAAGGEIPTTGLREALAECSILAK